MSHQESKLDLAAIDPIPLEDGMSWLPIRRTLGVTGFSINGYSAESTGDTVIETHDETGSGAGGHEELYVVTTGRVKFSVDGQESELGSNEMVLVGPESKRGAKALEDGTTVLVIGAKPGAALPVSPFEHWYAAIPAHRSGDYETAYETIAKAFDDYPDHPRVHYELACIRARQGRVDEAIRHLSAAIDGDPKMAEWAAEDEEFDPIRSQPGFPL